MNPRIIFLLLAAVYASAQSVCPPINFLNAKTISLAPTKSAHLVLLRQSDGSYTSFEVEDTSPYAVLHTIPHFDKEFSNCLPRKVSSAAGQASSLKSSQGAVAQSVAFAVLDSGNYLFVSSSDSLLDVAVFSQRLELVSENPSLGTGGSYVSVILADVNGDGKLDLIAQYQTLDVTGNSIVSVDGGGVQVFLGDGLGGFQLAGSFTLAGSVNGSMAVGDLNGDGKPDIVVGTPALSASGVAVPAGSLVLALGKGDGTFVTSTLATPNEVGPAAIAIADLNGDGRNDLVFLTSPLAAGYPYTPNEVVVMLGHGDGTVSSQAVVPVNVTSLYGTPGAIAIGDVNGDGIPDVVTNGITILLGDGKGGFPTRKDFLNTNPNSVILTDFDGDGKMDVLIGQGTPLVLSQGFRFEGSLTVFFGDGTGGLAAAPVAPSPTPATQGASPSNLLGADQDTALTSGDFNKDGIADLAFVSEFQYLSVFLGSASGAITPVFTYDFDATGQQAYPSSVVAGDFNQDGVLDLAVSVSRPTSPGSIMVFLGKGDGTFLAPVSSNAPGTIWSLVTGDFNKDGRADLAAITASPYYEAGQVVVFLGQGDGTFTSSGSYPAGTEAVSLAVADFNQDGFADIAIANATGISFLLGKGDGTFSPGTNISFPLDAKGFPQYYAMSLAAADLNGNGKLDLVAGIAWEDGTAPPGAAILLGHGDGTFGPTAIYSGRSAPGTFLPNLISVVVGDINGDGIPDIFLGDASVLVGNGDGTFGLQAPDLPALFGPLIAADFNGGGKLDVAGGFYPGAFPPPSQGAAIFFNFSSSAALLNVVSAADFSQGPFAPHSIVSAFGKHLALNTASAASPIPPDTLGGASVSVQDQMGTVSQAGIYFASPGQVNFVLPQNLEIGTAIVTITTADGQSASTEIQIVPLAPQIFTVDPSGIPAGYAVRVGAYNVQTIEPLFTEQGGHFEEVPIDLSTGEVYLVLFGTGFELPFSLGGAKIAGKTDLNITYAGPQRQFPGLDQINILLRNGLAGSGHASVSLEFTSASSNPTITVYITIK